LEAYIHVKGCRNTITIPKDHILDGWWKHWRFQGNRFFKGLTNKGEHHPARILKCGFGHGAYSGFPIEMTNYVRTNLLATVAAKFSLKNILVGKNKVVKSVPSQEVTQ
jgi:hypothetical protein